MTTFKKLHQQSTPLLICNVWDVPSAKIAESIGFQAVGTSSAAIAKMLGYADGEEMIFSELHYIVKRIKANTLLPLSVDLEAGYSRDPLQIVEHIQALAELGVVGINLEDSIMENERILLPGKSFADTIYIIKKELEEKPGTDFQKNVWQHLLTIPLGEKTTYQTIAAQIEKPKAVRAVGAANGRNRIAIMVPCHRVIGSDGKLRGYGGGIERKEWLLAHEQTFL